MYLHHDSQVLQVDIGYKIGLWFAHIYYYAVERVILATNNPSISPIVNRFATFYFSDFAFFIVQILILVQDQYWNLLE